MTTYRITTFPQACHTAHIEKADLLAFDYISLDRVNSGSHITQLREGAETVGIVTLDCYPRIGDVHITYIEVSKSKRGIGLNKMLLTGVFDYAAKLATDYKRHMFLNVGYFTAKGERSVLPTLKELSVQYSQKRVTFDYMR